MGVQICRQLLENKVAVCSVIRLICKTFAHFKWPIIDSNKLLWRFFIFISIRFRIWPLSIFNRCQLNYLTISNYGIHTHKLSIFNVIFRSNMNLPLRSIRLQAFSKQLTFSSMRPVYLMIKTLSSRSRSM